MPSRGMTLRTPMVCRKARNLEVKISMSRMSHQQPPKRLSFPPFQNILIRQFSTLFQPSQVCKMPNKERLSPEFPNLTISKAPNNAAVRIITMHKPPENRLNVAFAQTIISALRHIEADLAATANETGGAVIITSFSDKFWCTGLELDESDRNPYANSDGFFPLLATLVDYPYPTIACVTGHTFGGAGPFSLSCDYRVMNSKRGFISMPPVNLGLHFDGIGALPRLKLGPKIARKMLLEAHRWTGKEALADGIVDAIHEPEKLLDAAIALAAEQAPRAKMGVYGLLRTELWGEALEKFKRISYTHRRREGTPAKAKI